MSDTLTASPERQIGEPPRSSNDNDPARLGGGVRARINYLDPSSERPRAYQYDPPPGVPLRTGTYAEYPVLVRNGRAVADDLSLDREGFLFARQPTAFERFNDSDAVKAGYYPEVERLVKQLTGARRVWSSITMCATRRAPRRKRTAPRSR